MTVKVNTLLIILGALVLAGGLILGLSPMTQRGWNCGSPFSPNPYTVQPALCSDTLSGPRGIALALTIPGGLLAVAGVGMSLAGTKKAATHVVGTEATPRV